MINPALNAASPESCNSSSAAAQTPLAKTRRVATGAARPVASVVDRQARFPHEAIAALRRENLLAAAIPPQLGGLGCSVAELAEICAVLGEACASTGMIFAMHQMQVACIARHLGGNSFFPDYLRHAARHQWLIASGTSETGIGGDLRSSIAALELTGDEFKLLKSCASVSYGAFADAILITARRGPAAPAGDQFLALIRKQDYVLDQTGEWDVLGMRGTCSPSFNVSARASAQQILPLPFRDIAVQTMIPYSHILWSAVWLGIAADAIATARAMLKQTARKTPKTRPLAAPALADAFNDFQQMRANVRVAAAEYDRLAASPAAAEALADTAYALRINNLKLASSRAAGQICLACLQVCGLAGYFNNSPFSLGRQLRDALSAPLMISNNRIGNTNASLLLVADSDPLGDL